MVWKIDGKTQLTGWKVYLAILVPKIIWHNFITNILDWTVAWIAGICHGNSQIILQLNGWEGLASKNNTHFETIWFQALLSLQLQGQIISWIYLNRQRFWHNDKIQCLNCMWYQNCFRCKAGLLCTFPLFSPETLDKKKTNRPHILLILHRTNFGFFPLLQRIVCWLA